MLALQRRPMAILAAAHLCDDINQSYIAALLPFLVAQRHLDFASAAMLLLAANMSSSVVQPAVGMLADRYALWWLVPLGLLLAGGGVAAIGIAPNFALMFTAALVSGLGIALFHPEGARIANRVAGVKKASGMRWFSVGGNLGFAIGPTFAAMSIGIFGLGGTVLALIPALIMAVIATDEIRRILPFIERSMAQDHEHARLHGTKPDNWPAFVRLGGFVTLRSMAFIGLVGFVPLYFVHVLHATPFTASTALSLMLAAGAAGTVTGGPLADQHGRKTVILYSTGGSAVLLAVLVPLSLAAANNAFVIPAAMVGFALLGFVMVACTASFVVLGQEYLPNRIGLASGVTLGLAISLGGISSPFLGHLGDTQGLGTTMYAITFLTAAAFLAALSLPVISNAVTKPTEIAATVAEGDAR